MKKYLFLFTIVLIFFSLTNISAFFYQSHEKWVIEGFDEVNSPTTEMCRPFLSVTINGDLASDSGVIYYSDSNDLNRKSYIYPHTLQGYKECMKDAGSDSGSKCFCIGNYLHIIQDSFSHNTGGLTATTLEKFLGNNYFGHMTVEKNFENLHMQDLKDSNPNLYNRVQDFDKKVLNDLIITDSSGKLIPGGKYLNLLNSMSGIDMGASVDAIRRGYLGVGFYDSVYKDKVNLPLYPYIIIPILLVGISFLIIILTLIFGKTRWKWLTIFIFLIILVVGAYIFISFWTGDSWKIITYIIEIPPKFGYLSVSNENVQYYDKVIQKATNDFLTSPESFVKIEDASGLTYKDSSGVLHQGSLEQSEFRYKYILFPLISILTIVFLISLFLKSFNLRPTNKIFNNLVKWFTIIGTIIFFIFVSMIIYGIFF